VERGRSHPLPDREAGPLNMKTPGFCGGSYGAYCPPPVHHVNPMSWVVPLLLAAIVLAVVITACVAFLRQTQRSAEK
jgi:hypothetical protein